LLILYRLIFELTIALRNFCSISLLIIINYTPA
jgi:hypothetical protein